MNTLMFRFKDDHSFDQRLAESTKIRQKYPQRIPVIVERVRLVKSSKWLIGTGDTASETSVKQKEQRLLRPYANGVANGGGGGRPTQRNVYAKDELADLDKHKFLVPGEITIAEFLWILRKRIALTPERGLFLFVGKHLPQNSACLSSLYQEFKDDDGFLYMAYSGENTFGGEHTSEKNEYEANSAQPSRSTLLNRPDFTLATRRPPHRP